MSLSCWMNSLEKQLVSEESPLCEVYSDRKRMACCASEMEVVAMRRSSRTCSSVMKEKSCDWRQ